MVFTTYFLKVKKKQERDQESYQRLRDETQAGNKEAKRIFHRINYIDDQIDYMKRSGNNIIDPAQKRFNKYLDKELIKALTRERRILLNLSKRMGRPFTYIAELKRRRFTR